MGIFCGCLVWGRSCADASNKALWSANKDLYALVSGKSWGKQGTLFCIGKKMVYLLFFSPINILLTA